MSADSRGESREKPLPLPEKQQDKSELPQVYSFVADGDCMMIIGGAFSFFQLLVFGRAEEAARQFDAIQNNIQLIPIDKLQKLNEQFRAIGTRAGYRSIEAVIDLG